MSEEENIATKVALMKEAEGLVEKIDKILNDEDIRDLTIEQVDMDVVYELLDRLWVLNTSLDLCEYLRPTLGRIQSAELMITLRAELESIGIPKDDQLTLVPMGLN